MSGSEQRGDDLLDALVAEYADRKAAGDDVSLEAFVERAPEAHRSALRRCLRMIDAGNGGVRAPGILGPGNTLGDFRILEVLGAGGMAHVYLAHDEKLDRRVALKVLRAGLAVDPRHRRRFLEEGRAMAKLRHENVVPIYAVGEHDGHHYIAMEAVPGPSLAKMLMDLPDERPWTPRNLADASGVAALADAPDFESGVTALVAQAAAGVAAAHAAGIVHRDLKPSNILVHPDGRVVVAGFGLAKGEADLGLTLTGDTLGTPYYMSPEQVNQTQEPIDGRTDVYSLGVTLYELLSGERPFKGDSAVQIFDAIREQTPRSLKSVAPACSADTQDVVLKAMAREPTARYPDMEAFAADLAAAAAGRSTRARAERGGAWRRFRSALRTRRTEGWRFTSRTRFLGLPLVDIQMGRRQLREQPGGRRTSARGWLAIGDVAQGFVAIGGAAAWGIIAIGGAVGFGVVSLGGALAVGALALGGGCGIGGMAFGGCAIGFCAVGGYAIGVYALGGGALGTHVITGMQRDPAAEEFFARWVPAIMDWLEARSR